jgi:hypothetical protein
MEDMEFLGNGSMMDLALKMGDLDRVLDEICQIDTQVQTSITTNSEVKVGSTDIKTGRTTNQEGDGVIAAGRPSRSFEDSATTDFSDDEIIDDSEVGNVGLVQMQEELLQAELYANESRRTNKEGTSLPSTSTSIPTKETAATGRLVTAVAIKPSQDCPVGIRMKTSKGVTLIVGILETGLLRDSDLKCGMELVSVNGVPVANAKHAMHLIQESSTKVQIVAME